MAALVEKPLADTVGGPRKLVEAAERTGVALMTGRRPSLSIFGNRGG